MMHILRTPMHEVSRQPDGKERWCFSCRARHAFELVVSRPEDPMSYYGPSTAIKCTKCGNADGDLFPGRSREWE